MLTNYQEDNHIIDRMRISLSVEQHASQQLTERCSQLFHQQLTFVLAEIIGNLADELSITEPIRIEKLKLDLPALRLSHFEKDFCHFLIPQLTAVLKKYVVEAIYSTQADNQQQSSIYQSPFDWLLKGEAWLLATINKQPNKWLPLLAEASLNNEWRIELFKTVSVTSIQHIGQLLAVSNKRKWPTEQASLQVNLVINALLYLHAKAIEPLVTTNIVSVPHQALLKPWFIDLLTIDIPKHSFIHSWKKMFLQQLNVKKLFASNELKTLQNKEEPLLVENAGVILLWPLLARLFSQLELMQQGSFIDKAAQLKAVYYLDKLIWNDDKQDQQRLRFSQLVCGLSFDMSDETPVMLEEDKLLWLNTWLAELPKQLPGLKRCKVEDLRSLFLQRQGLVIEDDKQWCLEVLPADYDVLLMQLPWSLNQSLPFPWLVKPITTSWSVPMQGLIV